MLRFYVAKFEDPLRLEHILSDEEEALACSSVLVIRRFLNDYGAYVTLLRNFMELEGYLTEQDRVFSQSRAINSAADLDNVLLEANRLAMNFLSGARSFIDLTDGKLGRRSTLLRDQYRTWKSVQYDESRAYRVAENLRNVAQHRDLPIRAYSATGQLEEDGSFSKSQALLIDREDFLESEKIQAPVRAELEKESGNIPVLPVFREYFQRLGLVQLQAHRAVIDEYLPSANAITGFVNRVGPTPNTRVVFLRHNPADKKLMFDLVDPHLHGVNLVHGIAAAIAATDFQVLDRSARNHKSWPGD